MKNVILTLTLLFLVLLQSFGQGLSATIDTVQRETLQLHKKGKFSYGKSDPQPIEKQLLGFAYGYTNEFRTIIATNSYAARELRKSYQYQALETGGRVIFYALIVKSFIYSLKKAKQLREGNFYGNPTPVVDAVNLTVSAGISFYGTIKRKKQMKKAVNAFNGEFIDK